MSFEPRRPRQHSPPPVYTYKDLPEYTVPVDLSSSPPVALLRLASRSLSEMEEQVFGHHISHSFTPSYSFDLGPAFPPLPTRQESVQNDMSSTQHQFEFHFPDHSEMPLVYVIQHTLPPLTFEHPAEGYLMYQLSSRTVPLTNSIETVTDLG
ncbi:hypothetical protein B0H17DRAFT_1144942 [Mycena rosella]|uniref:Uncharacterized protein n=1 Tax=Mycena rosella TaxID=1033263 RepID=A0AAD7CRM6_MYCRO|nr:hypothetical protein B0H17DRAFT_1144942 [Mycena rosella]